MVSGPDDETWKEMSPSARRAHWAHVAVVVAVLLVLLAIGLLRD
jgi:hypothetical protein